jgi:hypothetical protein
MSRRLQTIESNYGRDQGWFVEVAGKTVAVLTDCRFEDMFWDSYRVEPTASDPDVAAPVLSEEFWNRIDTYQPVFRVLPARLHESFLLICYSGGPRSGGLRCVYGIKAICHTIWRRAAADFRLGGHGGSVAVGFRSRSGQSLCNSPAVMVSAALPRRSAWITTA